MRRSTERILTTHVGSLPRPAPVVDLVTRVEHGLAVDAAALRSATEAAVRDAVRRQLETGLTIVNDGEQGKYSFQHYFRERVSGVSVSEQAPRLLEAEARDFPAYFARSPWTSAARSFICTGPLGYTNPDPVLREIEQLKSAAAEADGEELFMSAVSPGTIVRITPNAHYATRDEFEAAVCDAMKVEYEAIAGAGILLQIDCPDLGVQSRFRATTIEDHRRHVARNVELLNHATRDIAPERMRMHVCWGADGGPHHRDIPVGAMLDILLTARPQGMTVAGANGRHAFEWRAWADVKLPDQKVIVPGVVDSTTNVIEHPETVAERIVRYASVLGRENVIAGVDCGLDTVAGVAQVDPEIAWAKLRSLVAGAQLASKQLWG